MEKYFCKSSEDTLKDFNVSLNGLTEEQIKEQLNKYGENLLTEKKKKSIISIFLEQFKDLLVIILIAAAIISIATDYSYFSSYSYKCYFRYNPIC
ncbi:Calcium-transporting ATPase [Clostridioides difficile]|nr:Calcium-transporting ATPase [Clostridioides difficile]